MVGTAVILAGIPGQAFNATAKLLKNTFPVGYVFRGAASQLSKQGITDYTEKEVKSVLCSAGDAIFGHSRRSFSFCRNHHRPCAASAIRGKTCGKTEDQTCILVVPTRLVLIYQEGSQEDRLRSAFYHSAFFIAIPKSIYGKSKQTSDYCEDQIRSFQKKALDIEEILKDRGTPLLLPPKNFGQGGAVPSLLKGINSCANAKASAENFRREFYRRDINAFEGSRRIVFAPAERGEQHGRAGDGAQLSLALPKRFRLGCTYDNSQHWDVKPIEKNGFRDRKLMVNCREFGAQQPSKKHTNIWPDDWIGQL